MKYNYKYNYKYIFIIGLIFLIVVYNVQTVHYEEFTPYLRQIYRPYIRKTRIISESFIDRQKITITNFLRKIGIL